VVGTGRKATGADVVGVVGEGVEGGDVVGGSVVVVDAEVVVDEVVGGTVGEDIVVVGFAGVVRFFEACVGATIWPSADSSWS
jgi:hypothetical protein